MPAVLTRREVDIDHFPPPIYRGILSDTPVGAYMHVCRPFCMDTGEKIPSWGQEGESRRRLSKYLPVMASDHRVRASA